MSLLNPKALLPWSPPPAAGAAAQRRRAEIWPPPVRRGTQGLSVHVRGCRSGLRLLNSPSWRYVWVDVEIENTSRGALDLPRGRQVVLVDSVGYAYRDLNPLRVSSRLTPGRRRRMRYLFRAPATITIGKLRLLDPEAQPLAETGFVDLTIPTS